MGKIIKFSYKTLNACIKNINYLKSFDFSLNNSYATCKNTIRLVDQESTSALKITNINPGIRSIAEMPASMIYERIKEINSEIDCGKSFPFTGIYDFSFDDFQAHGFPHLMFVRQVQACLSYPPLMNDPNIPEDVKSISEEILDSCYGKSLGSYSEGPGVTFLRKKVADQISKRDEGLDCDWEHIYFSEGAIDGLKIILKILVNEFEFDPPSGILTPVPNPPIISRILRFMNLYEVKYNLEEDEEWKVNKRFLRQVMPAAKRCCEPRAIFIMNPGNPTGHILSRDCMEEIIKFASCEKLVILAFEVMQNDLYDKCVKFTSFKKVLSEMDAPYCLTELVSFNCASTGPTFEAGVRGGIMELTNIDSDVEAMIVKYMNTKPTYTIIGQVTSFLKNYKLRSRDPSYETYKTHIDNLVSKVSKNGLMLHQAFNKFVGMKCCPPQGGLYLYPSITLPQLFIIEAESKSLKPDEYYALQLLECTGVAVLPGSYFGNMEGTNHLRVTIHLETDKVRYILDKLSFFHKNLMKKYETC